MNIFLPNVIKLHLCYCFDNETSSGENLHIVPFILNNFFVSYRSILSRGKKIDINRKSDFFWKNLGFFFLRPYRPALTAVYVLCNLNLYDKSSHKHLNRSSRGSFMWSSPSTLISTDRQHLSDHCEIYRASQDNYCGWRAKWAIHQCL